MLQFFHLVETMSVVKTDELEEKEALASDLRGSLLEFTKYFFPILTSRDFIVSQPVGRESHHIEIAKALTKAARLKLNNHRLMINTPPGSGKSLMMTMFVAWTMAQHADSKYIYVSYSKTLADKMTEQIKRIMQLPHYSYLFDVHIRTDSKAKDYFQTTAGGAVASAGAGGTITGLSAGEPGLDRWSGCLLIDDLHKIDEAHSTLMREKVISNFSETLMQRLRGKNVPVILIGQRVHESDISQYLIDEKDGYQWEKVILKAIDEAGNYLYPEVYSKEMLLKKKETDPYVFSSQYQQEPVPAGGALFKPDWFVLLDDEPNFISTFVVADTAETSMTYNDATAISFFGVYELENFGRKTGVHALHWIDAIEVHVEPKDLKETFMSFWENCCRHKTPPHLAAIEKKSTGVSLISALSEMRGIRILNIERNRSSGSKTKRFLDTQPFAAEKLISLPALARHSMKCVEHMSKITANDTHARDDLADTLCDAVRIALAEKTILMSSRANSESNEHVASVFEQFSKINSLRKSAYAR